MTRAVCYTLRNCRQDCRKTFLKIIMFWWWLVWTCMQYRCILTIRQLRLIEYNFSMSLYIYKCYLFWRGWRERCAIRKHHIALTDIEESGWQRMDCTEKTESSHESHGTHTWNRNKRKTLAEDRRRRQKEHFNRL